MNAPRLPIVTDVPDRMQRILGEVYELSSHVLAGAPNGLVPLSTVDISTPAWHTVHARTTVAGGNTSIKVSLGLVHLLFMVNRTLAARVVVDGDKGAVRDAVEELARFIDRASAPMLPIKEGIPLSPGQITVAELYTHWGETFLVNHELAHLHGIDEMSLETMDVFAPVRHGPYRYRLEHAADLFAMFLLRQQVQAQGAALAGAGLAFTPEYLRRQERYVYTGAELALHAISFLEMYDGSARSPTHPSAWDRIIFLREAHRATGQTEVLENADRYLNLIRANAAQAITRAQFNAQVAVRNLREFLETGETPRRAVEMKIPDPIASLLKLSRAGSMRFLIEVLTGKAGLPGHMVDRALAVAKHHLPSDEPAYAPFWEALTSDEGDWA